MARIALINPPNCVTADLPGSPLALGYLASYLERRGSAVDIYDFEQEPADPDLLAEICDFTGYDLIGFATFTHTFQNGIALARTLKSRHPETVIVLGGHHATPMAQQILADFACIDYCIRGEGEITLAQLVQAIETGAPDYALIEGLVWRDGDTVRANPMRQLQQDLDAFPHPKRIVANDWAMNQLPWFFDHTNGGGRRYLNMVASRGCPYKCNYCAIPTLIGRKTRTRSIACVIEEILACHRTMKFEHVFFQDPNFFTNHKHALLLAIALHEVLPEVTFSFETRSDQICRKRETVAQLAKLGCLAITMGLESASPAVLARLNKGATPAQNEEALDILRTNGIRPQLYLIMFDPESTLDDLHLNLEFMRRNDLIGFLPHHYILYDRLQPLPGTEYWDYYDRKFGLDRLHGIVDPIFTDPHVEAVWNAVNGFRRTHDASVTHQISAIYRLKSAVRRRGDAPLPARAARAFQMLELAAIELRYLPYNVFTAALSRAAAGDDTFALADVAVGSGDTPVRDLAGLFRRIDALISEVEAACDLAVAAQVGGAHRAPMVKEMTS